MVSRVIKLLIYGLIMFPSLNMNAAYKAQHAAINGLTIAELISSSIASVFKNLLMFALRQGFKTFASGKLLLLEVSYL